MDDFLSPELNRMLNYLQRAKFISAIPRDRLFQLVPLIEKVELSAGKTLFQQGDDPDYLYILVKGKLISSLIKTSGRNVTIGAILPIEIVGEMGSFTGEPRSLTVEAVEDCELLRLSSGLFKQLCFEFPNILLEISKIIIGRSIKTLQLMGEERESQRVSLLMSLSQTLSHEVLQNKFKQYADEANAIFINGMETSTEQFLQVVKQGKTENRSVIVFMESWQQEKLVLWSKYLTTFYLIMHEGERLYVESNFQEIIEWVKTIATLRLELILFHPDNITQIVNTRRYLELANFSLHHHIRLNSKTDFERIMRFVTGRAHVLVLGGGGAKGLAHLGVIKALLENNTPIDAIGGTSVGSGFAACYALALNYEQTEKYVQAFKVAAMQCIAWKNITWPLIAMFSSNPLTGLLMKMWNNTCIEDLWIPYFAVSSNLSEHREVVHRSGLLWEAVRSSGSIPGILPPVVYDGQLLVDGGLLNNLPVDVMRSIIGHGHSVIASSLSKKTGERENYHFPPVVTLKQSLLSRLGWGYKEFIYPPLLQTFLDALLLGSSAREMRNCLSADILVKPNLSDFNMLSVVKHKEAELINSGYQETKLALSRHIKFKKIKIDSDPL